MGDSIPCPKCGRRYTWDGNRCCRKECRYGSGKKPRRRRAKIAGVYPVDAEQPIHLIELVLEGSSDGFEFGEVTQRKTDIPRTNWQVAYDDQLIGESNGKARYVFFFHYLDLAQPLITPAGDLILPIPTKMPTRLKHIKYEQP